MLNSIAECDDRIKPMCNEITLPTDSPTLLTVVTAEKTQTQSEPFPKLFISWHHTEIIALKELRWHRLVTHSKQCSRSQSSSMDSPGQECSFSSPQPCWGCSALHSSRITAASALGSPFACPECVFTEGAVPPWECGTAYQVGGSHEPESDAHGYRCRSCVSMLRRTRIHALSCFYFRAMGSWYNEGVFHMIVHIHFQETRRRKFLCLLRSVGGTEETLIPRPREQKLYSSFTSPPQSRWDLSSRMGSWHGCRWSESGFFVSLRVVVPCSPGRSWSWSCHVPGRQEQQQAPGHSLCSCTGNSLHPWSFRAN